MPHCLLIHPELTSSSQPSASNFGGVTGWTLATIGTEAQNELFHTFEPSQEGYWIGLNDISEEGTFVWEDGSQVRGSEDWQHLLCVRQVFEYAILCVIQVYYVGSNSMIFSAWWNSKPDDGQGPANDGIPADCTKWFVGGWVDKPCQSLANFVCSRPDDGKSRRE